jgi:hypothetical protein
MQVSIFIKTTAIVQQLVLNDDVFRRPVTPEASQSQISKLMCVFKVIFEFDSDNFYLTNQDIISIGESHTTVSNE